MDELNKWSVIEMIDENTKVIIYTKQGETILLDNGKETILSK